MTTFFCLPKTNPEETSVTKRNDPEPASNTNSNNPKGKGSKAFNFRWNKICDNEGKTFGVFNFGNKKTAGSTDKQDDDSDSDVVFSFDNMKIQGNQAKHIAGFCDFGNKR
ncbi:hypothetical protein L3X38_002185 [Prunus dulcis]|uniref:Uncharacterized protein n=1 Tax=Prunus dulcis TaxID=3755 RepID=A0AAD4ZKZ4_PRUDU|nr:hypothetical protein L3X38_002185 [Prunus dulcis]